MGIIPKDLKIYFIDVGQGDSCLIITPTDKKILIDGGEGNSDKYDAGKNIVLPYLLDRGITKLDYIIISHCDSDHIGGLFAVIEGLKVDKILIGKQKESSSQLQDLIKVANNKNIEIVALEALDKISIDKYIAFEVLSPTGTEMIEENFLNNNSLVIKLIYKEFSCMFTGDIEELTEQTMVKKYRDNNILGSTVLKIAHHRV